jgi:REP element-mobilizing transposase RayT
MFEISKCLVKASHRQGLIFFGDVYYVASSGGAPIEKLKEYIKSQDKPID